MQPIRDLRRRVRRGLGRGDAGPRDAGPRDAGPTEAEGHERASTASTAPGSVSRTSPSSGALGESRRSEIDEASSLLERGDAVAAVDLLAAANRRDPDPDLQIALVDLRRRAAAVAVGVTTLDSPWPPVYADPFPGRSGEIPVVDREAIDVPVMAGAVAHHGALIVRRMFDPQQVTAVRGVIDLAHDAHVSGANGSNGPDGPDGPNGPDGSDGSASPKRPDVAALRPLVADRPVLTENLRQMVARDGGIWLADSPRATAVAIDALWDAGVIGVMTEHFGARPVFSLQKSTLRRSQPVRKLVGWHQDGSFYDPDVRTMNVWVALSDCGADRPAPGLEIVPRRMEEILPVAGVPTKHSVDEDLVGRIAAETPTVFPRFDAGDAIVFDEHLLHRTHLPEGMTDPRYALECWFFAPSRHTSRYTPLLV